MNSEILAAIKAAAQNFRTMDGASHHMTGQTECILSTHNLDFYHLYFKRHNPSSNLPYHNEYHTECMVLNCLEGAYYEGVTGSHLRSLLAAALFHDFDHSGGHREDEYNIHRAVKGLGSAHLEVQGLTPSNVYNYDLLTPQELDEVIDTIKITKYPYDGQPVTKIQKIIRDADLMQVYETYERRLCKQFRGLKEEVEILHSRQYTLEEWATGCKQFNDAVVWHTDWAKRKAMILDHAGCTEKLQQLLLGYK